MSSKFSTAASHAVLAGTGLFCLSRYRKVINPYKLPILSYQIILAHSCTGILKYGFDNNHMDSAYELSKIVQALFFFPCIVAQLWLNYGYQIEIACLHIGASLFPLVMHVKGDPKPELVDVISTVNVASAMWISMDNENWYGVAFALLFAYTHAISNLPENDIFLNMPKEDTHSYCYCVLSLLALHALGFISEACKKSITCK